MACRLGRKAGVNRATTASRLGPLGAHPARLRAPLASDYADTIGERSRELIASKLTAHCNPAWWKLASAGKAQQGVERRATHGAEALGVLNHRYRRLLNV